MLAATDADADTEDVPVEGAARPKQKFVRRIWTIVNTGIQQDKAKTSTFTKFRIR